MTHKIRLCVGLVAVAVGLAAGALAPRPLAGQTPAGAGDLEELFGRAAACKGPEYVAARDAILRQGERAAPLLKGKLSDPDWHVSMLAQAMLERIADPERYRYCEDLVRLTVAGPGGPGPSSILPDFEIVIRLARGAQFLPARLYGWDRWDALREAGSVPFLIEVLVHGCVFDRPPLGASFSEADGDRKYSMDEAAEALGITRQAAQWWFTYGMIPYAERGPDGRLYVSQGRLLGSTQHYLAIPTRGDGTGRYALMVRCYAAAYLGWFSNPAVVPALLEACTSDESEEVRRAAWAGLGGTGSVSALGPLRAVLKQDPSPEMRKWAAEAIGQIGVMVPDPGAISSLEAALGDEDKSVRESAAKALVSLGRPDAVAALGRAFHRSDADTRASIVGCLASPWIRQNVDNMMGRTADRAAVSLLLTALKDDDARVRAGAAAGLGWLTDARAFAGLQAALQDESPGVRGAAARALGRSGGPGLAENLIAALKDTAKSVRLAAARGLGELGDAAAIGPLIDALAEADPNDRLTFSYALNQLTNQYLGNDPARWREWWEKNKSRFGPPAEQNAAPTEGAH
jgi:HEAT repeat protein